MLSVIGGIGFVIGPLFAGQLAPFGIAARLMSALGLEQQQLDLVAGALLILILFANPNGIAYASVQAVGKLAGRRRRRRPPPSGSGDDGPLRRATAPGGRDARRRAT